MSKNRFRAETKRPDLQRPIAKDTIKRRMTFVAFCLAVGMGLATGRAVMLQTVESAQLRREADSLNLAGGHLGDLVENDDLPRSLEIGKASSDEGSEFLFGCQAFTRQNHGGGDLFAELGVRHTEYDRLCNVWVIEERFIDLTGEIFSPPRLMISLSLPVMYT